jgi:hypothetical protein
VWESCVIYSGESKEDTMDTAYIVKGHIINHTTIRLAEAIPIEDNEVTVIIETTKKIAKKRIPGLLKGKIWMSPDFNEPIGDFKEYMV